MHLRQGQYKKCFTPKTTLIDDNRGTIHELSPNKPLCKNNLSGKYFYANYTLLVNCRGIEGVGTCPYFTGNPIPIDLIDKGDSYEIKIGLPNTSRNEEKAKFPKKSQIIKDISKSSINKEDWFLFSENSLQQTLEYVGKNGEIIKFIYSEFKDGMARDAFTREFSIDLNEGNVGAYKGAIFEIIEATNSNITYKVIRHFQS